jgi:short-subunit dehydrogenase
MKTVLITGASTGIGYNLAHLFAKDKNTLLLVARNEKKLQEVASELQNKYQIQVYILAADLSNPDSPKQIYGFAKGKGLFIETLVNNAGFGSNGKFSELPLTEELEMVQVNITSLIHLTRIFLPEMIQNKGGKILNVASTASFQPGPYMTNYYATKAYVLHFTEGLAEELKDDNVTVSALCPGPTLTEFQSRANLKNALLLRGPLTMSSQKVAEVGYKGLLSGNVIIIPGFMNWLASKITSITPRFLVRKITAMLNKTSE